MQCGNVTLGDLGIIFSIIVTLIGSAWYLRGRLDGLEARLARFEDRLNEVGQHLRDVAAALHSSVQTSNGLFAIIFRSLQRQGALSSEDIDNMVKVLRSAQDDSMKHLIGSLSPKDNPMTPEEIERLRLYLDMTQQGTPFNSEQAQDFYLLSNKVAQERHHDPGIWPLLALGAFILGLYIGTKRQGT